MSLVRLAPTLRLPRGGGARFGPDMAVPDAMSPATKPVGVSLKKGTQKTCSPHTHV